MRAQFLLGQPSHLAPGLNRSQQWAPSATEESNRGRL